MPYLFSTATKGASPVEAIAAFLAELRDSALPRAPDLVPAEPTTSWPDAFRVLASVLPDSPTVVVLDELPWLAEQDEIFDGALQTAWDRLLSKRPMLLLLLGSDLHMMERLTASACVAGWRPSTAVRRTAAGMPRADTADLVRHIPGPHRVPGALRRNPAGRSACATLKN